MFTNAALFWGSNGYFHSPPLSQPPLLLNPSDLVLCGSAVALLLCICLLLLQPVLYSLLMWFKAISMPLQESERHGGKVIVVTVTWIQGYTEWKTHSPHLTDGIEGCDCLMWSFFLLLFLFFSKTCLAHWARALDVSPPRRVFDSGYGWVWRLAPRVSQL